MPKESGVPLLHWEKCGENLFGINEGRVYAIIARYDPKNKATPQPAYDVQLPEKMFVDLEAAKAFVQAHKRCVEHGAYMCGCMPVE